jgi:hypothetical protein
MSVPNPSPAPKPERNTVRIFQTHNAAGAPVPAEYVRVIHHNSINTLGSDAMEFLAPLNPTQTEHPGVFRYSDPANGSGWLRLEEFLTSDASRIQELVRMAEINRAVGKEPFGTPDLAIGNALVMRTNNPWMMFVLAAVSVWVGGASLLGVLTMTTNTAETIALSVLGVMMIGAAIVLVRRGVIQLRWWRKARAVARAQGGPMPSDLTGI